MSPSGFETAITFYECPKTIRTINRAITADGSIYHEYLSLLNICIFLLLSVITLRMFIWTRYICILCNTVETDIERIVLLDFNHRLVSQKN
jgi:hypothetical protein